MSHSFDFVGLSEKLFLLRHLISGTREYCRKEKLVQGPINYEDDWSNYYLRLQYLVSNDLIESAAKLRVIQDSSLSQLSESDIRDLDADCLKGQNIGQVIKGSFYLTLRESCNKIIHATKFELSVTGSRNSNPYYRYSYWNGRCQLMGVHSGRPWHVELNLYNWCNAMEYFLEELSGNVDW
ncbi:hypothetical protein [Halomonas alkalicola]|uniref:hypothetical protein n=1 Tax=Halomonas alkalicola TaxID=1930622 RepID=UPI00265F208F|nr:hypothetical protein [Halomonas alkalicola]